MLYKLLQIYMQLVYIKIKESWSQASSAKWSSKTKTKTMLYLLVWQPKTDLATRAPCLSTPNYAHHFSMTITNRNTTPFFACTIYTTWVGLTMQQVIHCDIYTLGIQRTGAWSKCWGFETLLVEQSRNLLCIHPWQFQSVICHASKQSTRDTSLGCSGSTTRSKTVGFKPVCRISSIASLAPLCMKNDL